MPDFLTIADIADILGVKRESVRVYNEIAQRNRRENRVRPYDMPEPMRRIGRTPIWSPDSIADWQTRRVPRRKPPVIEDQLDIARVA